MGKKIITNCDKCGQETDVHTFFIATGREWNGVETETNGVNLDLCLSCVSKSLEDYFLSLQTYESAKAWLNLTKKY